MGLIRNIVIAVSAISFLTFVALFGQLPALRKTPIGWLHRLLRYQIPNAFAKVDGYITGGKIAREGTRLGNYLFYKKNPVVLIIFLILLTGSAGLFVWHAVPKLPSQLILPIPLLLVQPYLFTWLCAKHTGHHITPATHSTRAQDYPYDHVLFRPGNVCATCRLAKPARSKHCSFCGVCIAMCDHHCPWVNNCVGRGNYRYFLGLLLTLGLTELYGAYLSWWILRPYLKTNPANAFFSRAHFDNSLDIIVVAINVGGLSIAGVGMLAAATGFLPLGLLAYHCYLIWAGMTTNESQKWADWRDDMLDGCVLKGSRQGLESHHRLEKYRDRGVRTTNGSIQAGQEISGSASEVNVPWPMSTDQVLICTQNGQPPVGEEGLWKRVWSLRDIDNIYDLGGWQNFMEIFAGR